MAIETYVFCQVTGKMVKKGTEQRIDPATRAPMIIPPLKPFISPITGEEITCREQLRRHNREHGVTQSADYSPEWMERKAKESHDAATGNTPEARRERIEAIKHAIYRS